MENNKRKALGRGLEQLFSNESLYTNPLEEKIVESTPKEDIVEVLKEEDFIMMLNEISYELDILDGKLEVIEIDKVIDAMGMPINYKEIARMN